VGQVDDPTVTGSLKHARNAVQSKYKCTGFWCTSSSFAVNHGSVRMKSRHNNAFSPKLKAYGEQALMYGQQELINAKMSKEQFEESSCAAYYIFVALLTA